MFASPDESGSRLRISRRRKEKSWRKFGEIGQLLNPKLFSGGHADYLAGPIPQGGLARLSHEKPSRRLVQERRSAKSVIGISVVMNTGPYPPARTDCKRAIPDSHTSVCLLRLPYT